MDDLLDVEKLNKFLESESGDYQVMCYEIGREPNFTSASCFFQNNLKSELHEFINVAEEEESDSVSNLCYRQVQFHLLLHFFRMPKKTIQMKSRTTCKSMKRAKR